MRVFVLGAGASKSCRLPLTNELLPGVLPAIDDPATRTGLEDFIRYLYPHFRSAWRNYPNLEELLSLIDTYLEFSPKVKRRPKYGNPEVIRFKRELLRAISIHLCQQVAHVKIQETQLFRLVRRLRRGDVVITFNWDFTVERALVELNRFGWVSYTLDPKKISLLRMIGPPKVPPNWLRLKVARPTSYEEWGQSRSTCIFAFLRSRSRLCR